MEHDNDIDEVNENELGPSYCAKLCWIFGLTEKEVQAEYKLYLKDAKAEDFEMYLASLYNTRTCFETLDVDRY